MSCSAIFAAQFPYWMVRQPSEIFKVRKQAGSEAEKQVDVLGHASGRLSI
jgi:hypothetical protein